jgi:hypothetical protein
MDIAPGITSSEKRNPPENWDFAGNNLLIEADSDWQDHNP